MRSLSLDFRKSLMASDCEEVPIVLVTITHPSLSEPLRLASGFTVRLSDDPVYAVISKCEDNATARTYYHVLMNMIIPDDKEGEALAAQIQLENVEYDAGPLLAPIVGDLKCAIRIVLASSPDFVEVQYLDLDLVSAQGADGSITLSAGREDTSFFTLPGDRMTKDRFPGLF